MENIRKIGGEENMKNIVKKQTGITLIALVVTMIVLLILAGITIATLTGNNGILTRAQEAKNKTEQTQKEEQNILNSYEDKINEYAGIDWDTVLANAQKHPDQKTSTAIGVGTDGRAVNMDLWEYNFDDVTNGYGLNDSASLATSSSASASKGYNGTNFDNIVIPQYISDDSGKTWKPVTNLDWLFFNCTDLIEINKLPNTVKSMKFTFRGCSNLESISVLPDELINMVCTFFGCSKLNVNFNIPNSVTNMNNTFDGCSSLENAPNIPVNVTTMASTFADCTNLILAPIEIPDGATNMSSTFYGCSKLETVPTIPSSVINMNRTFYGCSSLNGTIIINANISGAEITEIEENDYFNIFYNAATNEGCKIKLTGECLILQDIVKQTNRDNITL